MSSTAVTLTFARQSRDHGLRRHRRTRSRAGILLAWTVMFARVVIVEVAGRERARCSPACWCRSPPWRSDRNPGWGRCTGRHRRRRPVERTSEDVPLRNPFSLHRRDQFRRAVRGRAAGREARARRYAPADGHVLRRGARRHRPTSTPSRCRWPSTRAPGSAAGRGRRRSPWLPSPTR
ncbi:MAG: DUF4010 domain-containing protein [Comamonadaceae bacterium]|nr:DUF4010 domain-containing protein [Comamonadaceae bacterium]